MTLLNQAQFAKQLGYDRSYVTRLKHKGILVMRNGLVDVEESEKRIEQLRDPSKQGVVDRHAESRGVSPVLNEDTNDISLGAVDLTKADIIFKQRMTDLRSREEELRKRVRDNELAEGVLVVFAEMEAAVADGDAILRNRLESMPDQLSPMLAVEQDEQKIRALLIDYVEQMLLSISCTFAKRSPGKTI